MGRVRDDRGREVSALRIDDLDEAVKYTGRSLGRWVRLGWRVTLESTLYRAVMPMVVFAGTIAGFLLWLPKGRGAGILDLVALFLVFMGAYALGNRMPIRSMRGAMRRLRVCWSCAYDLAALAPEPDGCTVCPECGAAWRLESDA